MGILVRLDVGCRGGNSSGMTSYADAARILDFSSSVPLPGGRSWTARFNNWEPDRLQIFEFIVTITGPDGTTTTTTEHVTDACTDAHWAAEPGRSGWNLDLAIRRSLGFASSDAPLCPY